MSDRSTPPTSRSRQRGLSLARSDRLHGRALPVVLDESAYSRIAASVGATGTSTGSSRQDSNQRQAHTQTAQAGREPNAEKGRKSQAAGSLNAPKQQTAARGRRKFASIPDILQAGWTAIGAGFYRRGHRIWELRAAEDGHGFLLVRKHEERDVDFRGDFEPLAAGQPKDASMARQAAISSQEYQDEIESMSKNLIEEYIDSNDDYPEDSSNSIDYDGSLHNAVDGHQWIIYTRFNQEVIDAGGHSNVDVDGLIDTSSMSADEICDKLVLLKAFEGMRNDIHSKVDELIQAGWGVWKLIKQADIVEYNNEEWAVIAVPDEQSPDDDYVLENRTNPGTPDEYITPGDMGELIRNTGIEKITSPASAGQPAQQPQSQQPQQRAPTPSSPSPSAQPQPMDPVRQKQLQDAYTAGQRAPKGSFAAAKAAYPTDKGLQDAYATGNADMHGGMFGGGGKTRQLVGIDSNGFGKYARSQRTAQATHVRKIRSGSKIRVIRQGQVADAVVIVHKPNEQALDLLFAPRSLEQPLAGQPMNAPIPEPEFVADYPDMMVTDVVEEPEADIGEALEEGASMMPELEGDVDPMAALPAAPDVDVDVGPFELEAPSSAEPSEDEPSMEEPSDVDMDMTLEGPIMDPLEMMLSGPDVMELDVLDLGAPAHEHDTSGEYDSSALSDEFAVDDVWDTGVSSDGDEAAAPPDPFEPDIEAPSKNEPEVWGAEDSSESSGESDGADDFTDVDDSGIYDIDDSRSESGGSDDEPSGEDSAEEDDAGQEDSASDPFDQGAPAQGAATSFGSVQPVRSVELPPEPWATELVENNPFARAAQRPPSAIGDDEFDDDEDEPQWWIEQTDDDEWFTFDKNDLFYPKNHIEDVAEDHFDEVKSDPGSHDVLVRGPKTPEAQHAVDDARRLGGGNGPIGSPKKGPRGPTKPAAPAAPAKWSCGHKREPNDKSCPVCKAVSGRTVTSARDVALALVTLLHDRPGRIAQLSFEELPLYGQVTSISGFAPQLHGGVIEIPEGEEFDVEGFFRPDQDKSLAQALKAPMLKLVVPNPEQPDALENIRILLAPKNPAMRGFSVLVSPTELQNFTKKPEPARTREDSVVDEWRAIERALGFDEFDPSVGWEDPSYDPVPEMPGAPVPAGPYEQRGQPVEPDRRQTSIDYGNRPPYKKPNRVPSTIASRGFVELFGSADFKRVVARLDRQLRIASTQLPAPMLGAFMPKTAIDPSEAYVPGTKIYSPTSPDRVYEMVGQDFQSPSRLVKLRSVDDGSELQVSEDELWNNYDAVPEGQFEEDEFSYTPTVAPPPEPDYSALRNKWLDTSFEGDEPTGHADPTAMDPVTDNVPSSPPGVTRIEPRTTNVSPSMVVGPPQPPTQPNYGATRPDQPAARMRSR
jgi:hypothetical protein